MNQRICAVNETVQPVGKDVLVNRTIDAFQNGYSAMERMTAEITGALKYFSWNFDRFLIETFLSNV